MGQYYMPILGDVYGLNCKVFDRSVNHEYTLAKRKRVTYLTCQPSEFTLDDKFLINHDTRQFIDLNEYKAKSTNSDGRIVHPLPLLTAILDCQRQKQSVPKTIC